MDSLWYVIALALAAAPVTRLTAQVRTNVPEAVSGAKAVTVERIKVRGDASLFAEPVRGAATRTPPEESRRRNRGTSLSSLELR
jgi:hypothetical protein